MRVFRLIVAGLFAMLAGSAVSTASCAGFTDVDGANATYCPAVTYLKSKGITLGCTGTTYCPNDYVTRLQMALFLQRMGRGDPSNTLGDHTTTIGGGISNSATGDHSIVAGGWANEASGSGSTVPGGVSNVASGIYSFAAAYQAHAERPVCVVFSLWDALPSLPMSCLGVDSVFRIGATNGFSIDYREQRPDGGGKRWVALGDFFPDEVISAWTGAHLTAGGAWTNGSDQNSKTDFATVDPRGVLEKVAEMPISTWRYKTETGQIHLGSMRRTSTPHSDSVPTTGTSLPSTKAESPSQRYRA